MIKTLLPNELWLTREVSHSFFEESGIGGMLDFSHFCHQWGSFIALDIGCVMLYMDVNGQAAGIIGGLCTQCSMTGDFTAQEVFWWVHPRIRSTSAGIKLFKAWEAWGIGKKAVRTYVGNLWSLNNEKMKSLYSRLGYTPTEIHYVKNN